MNITDRRIRKLEDRFGTGSRKPRLVYILCRAGGRLALDTDTCIQIIDECGFLPTDPIGLVNLADIPDGLSAQQTERLLPENGPRTLWSSDQS